MTTSDIIQLHFILRSLKGSTAGLEEEKVHFKARVHSPKIAPVECLQAARTRKALLDCRKCLGQSPRPQELNDY